MGWCVPACVDMVLRYLKDCHGLGIECPSQLEIAKLCGTTEGGTQYDAVVRLNAQTQRYIPSVDFDYVTNRKLQDLNKELSKNLPVLAFIEKKADNDAYPHTIVISGLDMAGDRILYNDPMGKANEVCEIGRFMEMWAKDFCVWFISIGLQRKLGATAEMRGEESGD